MDNELMKKLRLAMSRKAVNASPPFYQVHNNGSNVVVGGSSGSASNYYHLLQDLVSTLTQSEHTQFTFANHKKRVETCRVFLALWRYLLRLKDVLPKKEKHLAFQLITCLMKRQEFDPIVHKKYDRLESQSNSARFFSSLLGKNRSRGNASSRSRSSSSTNSSTSSSNIGTPSNTKKTTAAAAAAMSAAEDSPTRSSSSPSQSPKTAAASAASQNPQLTDVMQEYKILCEETLLEVLLKLRRGRDKLYQDMYAYCAGVLAISMLRLFDPDRQQHHKHARSRRDSMLSLTEELSNVDTSTTEMSFEDDYILPSEENVEIETASEIDRFMAFFQKRMMQFPHLRWIHDNASLSDVEKIMKSSRKYETKDMDIESQTSSFVDAQLILSPETSNNTSSHISNADDQNTSRVQWMKQFYGQLFRFNYSLCQRENDGTNSTHNTPTTPITDASNIKKAEQQQTSPRQQHDEHIQKQLKEHRQSMFNVSNANAFEWIPTFAESSEFFYVFICDYVSQAKALLSTHLNLHYSNIPHYRGLMIGYVQSLQNFDPRFHATASSPPPPPSHERTEKLDTTEDENTKANIANRFYNPLRYLSMYRQHMNEKGMDDSRYASKSETTLSKAKVFHQKATQRQRKWSYESQRKWVASSFVLLKNNPQFINLLLSLFIPSTKTYALNSEVFPLLEYMDLWFREYRNSHIDALQQRFQRQHEIEKVHYQELQKSASSSSGGKSRLFNLLISPLQISSSNRSSSNQASGANISGGGIPMAATRRNDIYETSVYLPAVGFPLDLFINMIDQLIETNHFQTTVRTLILIYNIVDMFGTKEERTKLIHDCLLKRHFWELFLHWNEDTRACFHRILIYKVKRYTPPPQLMDIQMRLQQTHIMLLRKRQRQKAQAIRFTRSKPGEGGQASLTTATAGAAASTAAVSPSLVAASPSPSSSKRSRKLSLLSSLKRVTRSSSFRKQSPSSASKATSQAIESPDKGRGNSGASTITKLHSKSVDSLAILSESRGQGVFNHHDDGYHSDSGISTHFSDSDTEDDLPSMSSGDNQSEINPALLPPELQTHASDVIASDIGTSLDSLYGSDDLRASLAAEEELDLVLKSKADAFVQVVFITPPAVDIEQERMKKSQLRLVSSAQDEYSSRSHIVGQKQTHSLVAKREMTRGNLQKKELQMKQQKPTGSNQSEDDIVHIPQAMTIPHDLRVYIPQAKRAYKTILMEYQQWKIQIDEYFISHAHQVHLCDMLLIDIPYPTITFPQWDIRSDSNV